MAGQPDYRVLRANHGVAYAARELAEGQLRRLLDDPAAPLWENLHRPVKIGHSSLMVQAELHLLRGPVRAAYKQYRARNWWKSLCGVVRRGRAQLAWDLGRRLSDKGIPTARPLAMCQPRRLRLFGASYLATEWIESAENLHLFGWRLAAEPPGRRLRSAAQCAQSLGRLVGRMHAEGIAHRDLKGANLLVAQRGERLMTFLIDVDGLRFCRRVGPTRRAANLARLAAGLQAHPWITRTICCRFLRAYASRFPTGAVAWKPLWREVAARSRRIVRRKLRRDEQVL